MTFVAGLLLVACFSPASPDVTFTCDPNAGNPSGACPADYRCELDGCCHKVGSDVQGNLGACLLGLDGGSETDDSTAGTDSTQGDGSGTGTGTGTSA